MMHGKQIHSLVATFPSHTGAEGAIQALHAAGLDMKRLSIVGRDFHAEEHARGLYTSGDRMKFWGGRGAIWGSLWDLLQGGGLFFVPSIGPLVVMGPLVGWIAGALQGAAAGGDMGALGRALASVGIPEESVVEYEREVKAGRFLVLAHGSAAFVNQARAALAAGGAAAIHTHLREEYRLRDAILGLLSDVEVARVSAAEGAPGLVQGDEYLDLDRLDQGVHRAAGPTARAGSLLPRKVLADDTWDLILSRLPSSRSPSPRPAA
ncbi:MAG: hypothetical protein HZB56_03665 [Deltaproteobacteria bacterium]|nr:hypothetical protein [Deltaproteobacteria bacterium]